MVNAGIDLSNERTKQNYIYSWSDRGITKNEAEGEKMKDGPEIGEMNDKCEGLNNPPAEPFCPSCHGTNIDIANDGGIYCQDCGEDFEPRWDLGVNQLGDIQQ
jgi:hypothetical protein